MMLWATQIIFLGKIWKNLGKIWKNLVKILENSLENHSELDACAVGHEAVHHALEPPAIGRVLLILLLNVPEKRQRIPAHAQQASFSA